MTTQTLTTEDILAAMKAAVEATPSLKSKFNAIVEFHLNDNDDKDNDQTTKSITLDISKSATTMTTRPKPDLVVRTSREILIQILNKKLTPQQAFMQGKLKIKGNMGLAMKLTLVVNATRKQLQKKEEGDDEEGPRSKL